MPVEHKTVTFKSWISVFAGLALSFCTFLVHSSSPSEAQPLPGIPVTELPREGQTTYQLIRKGGPFPYEKDGVVFGNRERILPRQARGYYREYTVKTPGSRDRGARRIVCGGEVPVQPVACYYTADHYASFRVIVDKN
jgi:ribonuclease T1